MILIVDQIDSVLAIVLIVIAFASGWIVGTMPE